MYVFKWREELLFAAAVFIVYVGTAYVATDQNPVTNWGDWVAATLVAGSRVAVAALVNPIARWIASRDASG
ncbi:MAG: hypothetical protein KatS3mg064_0581 [Tepidiforma sp.]|nr:hypothetical protein [Tepidiforma sp.]GIW17424.1 MAG: hypothetical protein KatS3mg064_0581 [Tepidiforma sp.]